MCQCNNILNNLWGNKERLEGKYLVIFEAEPLRFDRVNQFSLEELCRTQCSLKILFEAISSIRPSRKTLKFDLVAKGYRFVLKFGIAN